MARRLRFLLVIVALLLSVSWLAAGSLAASAQSNNGASCVREFFTVARADYGWSPQDVVRAINTDGDPNYQVANLGDLINRVANAEIGIFDTSGVYHICPNPQ
jgi:hypothetical protein